MSLKYESASEPLWQTAAGPAGAIEKRRAALRAKLAGALQANHLSISLIHKSMSLKYDYYCL